MKRTLLFAACISALLLGSVAIAHEGHDHGGAAKKADKATGKGKYLVIATHTAEGCLAALDKMEAAKVMDKFDFGCGDGDHTGYLITPAASPEAALAMVPEADRGNAKAVKLSRFTAAQLKAFHAKMAN